MEEKEFKERFYTTKTYKFEPPTWKEFLATRDKHTIAHWCCGDIAVYMIEENSEKDFFKTYNQFEVYVFSDDEDSKRRVFDYCVIESFGIDTREETYYEALDYAKELFLGGQKQ